MTEIDWNIASNSRKNDIAQEAGLIRVSAFDQDLPCWHELPLAWRQKLTTPDSASAEQVK